MLVGRGALDISLYADSAVGRDVQPLFIPEVEGPWSVTLMPAFRVGRLGKSVPEKFAARYIDGVSVVALMHPTAIPPRAGAVPGWLSVMDSAVTTGHWLPFDATSAAADCVRTHGPCVLVKSTMPPIPLTFCRKHPIIPLTFCRKQPIIPLTFCTKPPFIPLTFCYVINF